MTSKVGASAFVGLTVVLAVVAVAWTVVSASALSHTFDEPHHLATGIEWWQFGTYRWWTENPPLPKLVTALVPYLAGMRLPANPASLSPLPWGPGIELLNADAHYERTLALVRVGTLVFLLLTLGLTFVLAGGRRRPFAAFLATALVATYPPLLGHAGFATTDVAAVATALLFLWALDRWADVSSRPRAAALGAAFALALLCKLTAPLVCAALGVGWLCGRRWSRGMCLAAGSLGWREVLRQVALAGVAAVGVVWAGYRFSTGRLDDLRAASFMGTPVFPPLGQRSAFLAWVCRLRLPAPELWQGFFFLKAHNAHGHPAYLFGQIRDHGFWSFYLVGLFLKSPLPFLFLAAASVVVVLVRRRERTGISGPGIGAGAAVLALLLLSTAMTVNIGVRHVLVVIPLLAIFIAGVLAPWLESLGSRRRVVAGTALGLLLVAEMATVQRACPELMAYFNPLAGKEPGRALIDSDLDWGQDFLLLKRELHARRISSVHYGFFGTVDPCGPDVPTLLPLLPRQPVTGWIVLSEQFYRSNFFLSVRRESCTANHYSVSKASGDAFDWLKANEPVARVGASLRLYDLPDR